MSLYQFAGSAVVLVTLADVFMTVLYARSGSGVFTPSLTRLVWRLFKFAAPSKGGPRDTVLSYAGPVIMVVTASTWILLLLVGFALIAYPALGGAIQASNGPTPTDFAAAVYYSGYSLTTLGTGDLVPQTSEFRLIMVLEAIVGFSVLTLTLTYFMSVYSALVRRNTLAQMLHQMSGGTGEAAELVAGLGPGGSFDGARSLVSTAATRVLDLLESHHSYPVLHYFRFQDPRYAMARIALLSMDTAAICKSALGPAHRDLSRSAAVDMLWGSGMDLLQQTGETFLPAGAVAAAEGRLVKDETRARFRRVVDKLEKAGIEPARGSEGEQAYVEDRHRWEPLIRAFATSMAHKWPEIDPAWKAAGRDRG